jgi:acetyltransferase-like isoleucine patch superfamily enzyme
MPSNGVESSGADPAQLGSAPSASARVDQSAIVGAYVVIEPNVIVEAECVIGNHVTLCEGAHLQAGARVADFAVVGRRPSLGSRSTAKAGALPGVVVGAHSSIGSHTVVMAGTTLGSRCIVGDSAGIRERCSIGDDVVVGRAVTVENDTTIGSRTKVQSGAYITAYVTIEDDVFIAPMVVTTNDNFMGRTEARHSLIKGCTIRRGARVGGGAHILPGIEVGADSFVATGSIVTRDVAPGTVVMGVPARYVKDVPAEQRLGGS